MRRRARACVTRLFGMRPHPVTVVTVVWTPRWHRIRRGFKVVGPDLMKRPGCGRPRICSRNRNGGAAGRETRSAAATDTAGRTEPQPGDLPSTGRCRTLKADAVAVGIGQRQLLHTVGSQDRFLRRHPLARRWAYMPSTSGVPKNRHRSPCAATQPRIRGSRSIGRFIHGVEHPVSLAEAQPRPIAIIAGRRLLHHREAEHLAIRWRVHGACQTPGSADTNHSPAAAA